MPSPIFGTTPGDKFTEGLQLGQQFRERAQLLADRRKAQQDQDDDRLLEHYGSILHDPVRWHELDEGMQAETIGRLQQVEKRRFGQILTTGPADFDPDIYAWLAQKAQTLGPAGIDFGAIGDEAEARFGSAALTKWGATHNNTASIGKQQAGAMAQQAPQPETKPSPKPAADDVDANAVAEPGASSYSTPAYAQDPNALPDRSIIPPNPITARTWRDAMKEIYDQYYVPKPTKNQQAALLAQRETALFNGGWDGKRQLTADQWTAAYGSQAEVLFDDYAAMGIDIGVHRFGLQPGDKAGYVRKVAEQAVTVQPYVDKERADFIKLLDADLKSGATTERDAQVRWAQSKWGTESYPLYGVGKSSASAASENAIDEREAGRFKGLAKDVYAALTRLYDRNSPRDAAFDEESHRLRLQHWRYTQMATNPKLTIEDLPESQMPKNYLLDNSTDKSGQASNNQRDDEQAVREGKMTASEFSRRYPGQPVPEMGPAATASIAASNRSNRGKQGNVNTTSPTIMDAPDEAAKAAALTADDKKKYGPYFSTAAMAHAPNAVRRAADKYLEWDRRKKKWVLPSNKEAEAKAAFKAISDREDAAHVRPNPNYGQGAGGGTSSDGTTFPNGKRYKNDSCGTIVKDITGYTGNLHKLTVKGKGKDAEVRAGNVLFLKADPAQPDTTEHWVVVADDGKHLIEGTNTSSGYMRYRTDRTVSDIRNRIVSVHLLPGKSAAKKPADSKVLKVLNG